MKVCINENMSNYCEFLKKYRKKRKKRKLNKFIFL